MVGRPGAPAAARPWRASRLGRPPRARSAVARPAARRCRTPGERDAVAAADDQVPGRGLAKARPRTRDRARAGGREVSEFQPRDGRPCLPSIVARQRLRDRLPADGHRAKFKLLLFGPRTTPRHRPPPSWPLLLPRDPVGRSSGLGEAVEQPQLPRPLAPELVLRRRPALDRGRAQGARRAVAVSRDRDRPGSVGGEGRPDRGRAFSSTPSPTSDGTAGQGRPAWPPRSAAGGGKERAGGRSSREARCSGLGSPQSMRVDGLAPATGNS